MGHEERDHALLSASSAHRWLKCTKSARLEEQFPDTTSEAAKEGTLAHELAELKCGIISSRETFPSVNLPLQSKNSKKILCGMTRC